ncbi:MAG TPA: CAP domain-containing protein [Candidatus Sulfotelmatobacter sp.]|nr:CAP domain-containing protein [Candidatus Sulfotelmatobacter sp.]
MRRLAAFLTLAVTVLPLAARAQEAWPDPGSTAPAAARQLAADVNAARVAHGLPPLALDARLSRFGLALAEAMERRHYFGHTDPDGVTFADRVRAAGLLDHFAAENIALDVDEQRANTALLHSPGHYRNIMDPRARTLGVAAVYGEGGELLFVEEFGG